MNLQAVEIESILYEDAVNSLLALMENRDAQGVTSRELHLVRTTSMIMENMDAAGKLASLASMALVMLHEERKKKHENPRGRAGRRS
jgi:hypothetical protein